MPSRSIRARQRRLLLALLNRHRVQGAASQAAPGAAGAWQPRAPGGCLTVAPGQPRAPPRGAAGAWQPRAPGGCLTVAPGQPPAPLRQPPAPWDFGQTTATSMLPRRRTELRRDILPFAEGTRPWWTRKTKKTYTPPGKISKSLVTFNKDIILHCYWSVCDDELFEFTAKCRRPGGNCEGCGGEIGCVSEMLG